LKRSYASRVNPVTRRFNRAESPRRERERERERGRLLLKSFARKRTRVAQLAWERWRVKVANRVKSDTDSRDSRVFFAFLSRRDRRNYRRLNLKHQNVACYFQPLKRHEPFPFTTRVSANLFAPRNVPRTRTHSSSARRRHILMTCADLTLRNSRERERPDPETRTDYRRGR